MILDTTSKSIQVVLGAPVTTTQAQIFASYADITPTTFAPASTDVASNNTTPVTVVAAPAASTQRQVKTLQVYNADTASMTVVVQLLDGATTRVLYKVTLAPGSTLMYTFGTGMRVTDTNGNFLESVQAQQSGSWTVSIAGTPNVNLANVGGSAISLGQKAMASSVPVVLASDQSALSVTTPVAIVDASNSTTANLGANATFTGAAVNVLGYSNIRVLLESNASSAANGLAIEFSNDGVNWDDSSVYTYTAGLPAPNQGQSFIAGTRGQFVRVVYTNGAVAQTNFRLQTTLSPTVIGGDVLSINGTVNDNNHGFLTVSQIVGKTTGGGGGYVPVKVNPSGTLTVDASNSTNVATVDNLTQVGGADITLAQKTMANSLPVVIASDQSNLSIIGSSKRMVSNVVTGTTPVSIITAAATILTGISVTIFGAVLGSIVNLQVKDGGGNVIFAVNLPTIATGPSTVTALLYEFTLLNIPLNNGGVNGTAALLSNLTSGSFLVAISTN